MIRHPDRKRSCVQVRLMRPVPVRPVPGMCTRTRTRTRWNGGGARRVRMEERRKRCRQRWAPLRKWKVGGMMAL